MDTSEPKQILTVSLAETEMVPLFERTLQSIRDDFHGNPYIDEALKVLPVGGYRSAIGAFWNAVVDDLRNKIIWRSTELFNKTTNVGRTVGTYEDFQTYVNDDQLIDGAYKIGVITFEASKVLKHAKETRHFFSGHPKSGEPTIIKVLAMWEDCIRYVLRAPYPSKIIDLDDYMKIMDSPAFDRNKVSIEIALTELPDDYKNELANRLFTAYCHPNATSTIRSNIEFVLPILWPVLGRGVQIQVIRRVDQEIANGDAVATEQAFGFASLAKSTVYLSPAARRYKLEPLVQKLKTATDDWPVENEVVQQLLPFAAVVPPEVVPDYVWGLTHTYVGYTGHSFQFARTNFYADGAASYIPQMFELFDDAAAAAFVRTVKESTKLQSRITNAAKLHRLRTLGQIVLDKVSATFTDRSFLEALVQPGREEDLAAYLRQSASRRV